MNSVFKLKAGVLIGAACVAMSASAAQHEDRWGGGIMVPFSSSGVDFRSISLIAIFEASQIHSNDNMEGFHLQLGVNLRGQPSVSVSGMTGEHCVQGMAGIGLSNMRFGAAGDVDLVFPIAVVGPYASLGVNLGTNFQASPFGQLHSLGCFDRFAQPTSAPPPPPPPPCSGSGCNQTMLETRFIQYARSEDLAGFEIV